MILHAADISHPAKIWKYHSKWSTMLTKEFFNQVKIQLLCKWFESTEYKLDSFLSNKLSDPGDIESIEDTEEELTYPRTSLPLSTKIVNGKKEKQLNIPISPLCNESTCNIAKSQIGFVTYIVKPCFELLSKMLKKILQQYYVEVGIPKSNSFIDFKEDVYEGLNSEIWFECCNSNILDWNKIVEKDENEQN
ncbi:hypothetical protein A3Q56_03722 [Intoshia linei]|uniref:PDEase domain-containing protein n=1 Tax=Intoshia linei TaxID=1819745 RepID=A0A177B2I6_9BILA|nr:hypothetical protein A3Q56_03722 [Intoshia linei]